MDFSPYSMDFPDVVATNIQRASRLTLTGTATDFGQLSRSEVNAIFSPAGGLEIGRVAANRSISGKVVPRSAARRVVWIVHTEFGFDIGTLGWMGMSGEKWA